MIRQPLGLRINSTEGHSVKEQLRDAARLGARGVVLDAAGDLGPERLSATGRRELRFSLRSVELALIALHLPTRRPFDTVDQLDDRLARAERACALAYELGAKMVLARVGGVPPETEADRLGVFTNAVTQLGRRADRHGVRLAIETAPDPGSVLRSFLDRVAFPGLAASLDPAALLSLGIDPVAAAVELGPWVAHAYAPSIGPGVRPQAASFAANPRGFGFAPGVVDWENYLGALEEIDYRGFLTVWPDPTLDAATQFQAVVEHVKRF